jgi:hypothetical protein
MTYTNVTVHNNYIGPHGMSQYCLETGGATVAFGSVDGGSGATVNVDMHDGSGVTASTTDVSCPGYYVARLIQASRINIPILEAIWCRSGRASAILKRRSRGFW